MNTYDNRLLLAGIVCFLLLVTVYGKGKSANQDKKHYPWWFGRTSIKGKITELSFTLLCMLFVDLMKKKMTWTIVYFWDLVFVLE